MRLHRRSWWSTRIGRFFVMGLGAGAATWVAGPRLALAIAVAAGLCGGLVVVRWLRTSNARLHGALREATTRIGALETGLRADVLALEEHLRGDLVRCEERLRDRQRADLTRLEERLRGGRQGDLLAAEKRMRIAHSGDLTALEKRLRAAMRDREPA